MAMMMRGNNPIFFILIYRLQTQTFGELAQFDCKYNTFLLIKYDKIENVTWNMGKRKPDPHHSKPSFKDPANSPLPVLRWRKARLLLEETTKGGLFGEAHQVGNLLDGEVALLLEHCLGLKYDVAVDPLASRDARLLLDERGEILGREVEHAGIEAHFARLTVVLDDSIVELLRQKMAGILLTLQLLVAE